MQQTFFCRSYDRQPAKACAAWIEAPGGAVLGLNRVVVAVVAGLLFNAGEARTGLTGVKSDDLAPGLSTPPAQSHNARPLRGRGRAWQ
ncbi:MAG: hypothetical protein HC828_04250 [Blastochloris sp.]|nr:hypothetical protein [Blastochloris sp.]